MKTLMAFILLISSTGCVSSQTALPGPRIIEHERKRATITNSELAQREGLTVIKGQLRGEGAYEERQTVRAVVFAADGVIIERAAGCVEVSRKSEWRSLQKLHRHKYHSTANFLIPLKSLPPADGRIELSLSDSGCS